jgi:hypothetical protein
LIFIHLKGILMKFLTKLSLPILVIAFISPSMALSSATTNTSPFDSQTRLVEFAKFFTLNMAGKIFITSTRDRPYQDKIIDYEYDLSYHGLQIDPAGALTFKSTYNIKKLIYSADQNGKKMGAPQVKQSTHTSQCALRQLSKTTHELLGSCQKIADNQPNSSFLGFVRQLRITELSADRMSWKDNTVGYVEGFLLEKKGYSPQHEIQTLSFQVQTASTMSRQTLLSKTTRTYSYDTERDQLGPLLTETSSEIMGNLL